MIIFRYRKVICPIFPFEPVEKFRIFGGPTRRRELLILARLPGRLITLAQFHAGYMTSQFIQGTLRDDVDNTEHQSCQHVDRQELVGPCSRVTLLEGHPGEFRVRRLAGFRTAEILNREK